MDIDMKKFLVIVLVALNVECAQAQKVAVSTNLIDYVNYATLNADISYAVAQHWSLSAGTRYNPFNFPGGVEGGQRQNRQRTFSLESRYWPWHVYSGWWALAKVQYQEYNYGGIEALETNEGDRVGAGLAGGYAYMLGRHINVEMGLGVWSGADKYKVYACPTCGRTLDEGNKFFVMLDEVLLSLAYVF